MNSSAARRRARGGIGALLAAAAFGAQAQLDASYYGVFDLSYGRFQPSGLERRHRFNSNSLSASFVGVNLKQTFEGGWTPGVTLETFFRVQDWKTGRSDSDPLLSRKAFVSLASPYGTASIGRLQTLLFDSTVRFNALGNSLAFSPAIRHVFASGNLESVQQDFYWNRAVGYASPNWEGATLNLMYAKGRFGDTGDLAGGSLVYSQGLFAVALSAQKVHVNDGIDEPTDETTWQLGSTYNFGFATVYALWTGTNDRGLDVRSRLASAGLSVPLGPGSVVAQIGLAKTTGPAVDRKHTSTSAGYVYAYDSVTDFYLLGMDDRIRGQAKGISVAIGGRWKF